MAVGPPRCGGGFVRGTAMIGVVGARRLVHWCHGAPGMSMMLAMMSTVFGSVYPHDFDQFMQRCGASDVSGCCVWLDCAGGAGALASGKAALCDSGAWEWCGSAAC